jgi:glycosyltransferase involved in cell wall biosynthesis
MSVRPKLSVTILSQNEEKNIARAVSSVIGLADEVLVVDSGSTDRTRELAERAGARVLTHDWQGYGQQKNFAQQQAQHDWVLNIDADEEVSPALARELQETLEKIATDPAFADVAGMSFPRKTFYLGHWIRYGGWYPNVLTRICNRRLARWSEPEVHERLEVEGRVLTLRSDLHHYSFPSIESQVHTNLRFSKLGTQDLKRRGKSGNLAKLVLKPVGKFFETYLIKRGFLDGLPGFIISVNAAYSMFLKYAFLLESRITHESADHR